MKTIIFTLMLMLLSSTAFSQIVTDCQNPQTTIEIDLCAQQSYEEVVQKFGGLIRAVYACSNRPDFLHDELKADRVEWDKYIHIACEATANVEHGNKEFGMAGTLWNSTYLSCLERKTQNKITDYTAILNSYRCFEDEGLPEE